MSQQNNPNITAFPQGSSGSNKGQTTIVITGQHFSPTDQISIIAPNGATTPASKVYWVSETEAWATFDLQGLTTGKYDVKVNNGQSSAISNDTFTVTDGQLGNIQIQLAYPSLGQVKVTYTNIGETDVVAPLLRISATNAQVTYPAENTTSDTLRQLLNLTLGTSNNGPAGILAPGKSGQFSFKYTGDGNGEVSFAVEAVNPNEVINWASIKAESRADYSTIDSAAWDAIWTNLTAAVGTTAGQFQTVMAENASYLSQLGQKTNDLTRLFGFEWKQSVNTLTNISLTSTTDMVDAAPGLSLSFNRTFYQSIAERYNLGSLGRGWASQWDLKASTNSQGNVVIRSVGDLQRVFQKQANGTYSEYGGATLKIVNGEYQLKEANGTLSLFASDGKLSYVQDTNGNRISLQYTNNLLTKLVHTNGDSLTLAYNAQNRISQITDSTGQVSSYSYDATGESLLSVTTSQGTTTYTYDTGNVAATKYSLLSLKSDLGYQRSFEYDNQCRLTKAFSNGQTEVLNYSYDSTGGVKVTDSTGADVTFLLNEAGNAGQVRGVNNQNLLYRYDAKGNLTASTLPNGGQIAYSYDNKGNVTTQTDLLGKNTFFTYNSFNQLTGFNDPNGNPVGYSYDAKGNLNKITYADGSTEQFSVDGLGNFTSAVNRRGSTIQYTYNHDGQLTKKQLPDGSSVTYGYDTKGNLNSVTDAMGTITMQYDTANRMTNISYPTGRSLTYTYNADGQRTQLVSQDGYTVNYSYDTVGRLKTLTNATGQTIISYEYDSASRLTKETNGNGTYTTYQYDLQSQLTSLTNFKADNTVNSQFDYTYDKLGLRTSMTTLEGIFQYGYDANGQLTSVVTPTNRTINYQYDAVGNRIGVTDSGTTTSYTTNNLNQYTNVGNAVYAYDTDGNLISKTQGGQTSTYTYDVENRLTKVVNAQGTWDYQYDGLGNRVATIINGQKTEYLLDPTGLGDVVGEYDNNGNLVAHYNQGIGLVSRVDGSSVDYYDADAIGSTVGLTGSDGSYVNRYSYLPFGEDLTKVEGVANPFEYVGQWGVMDEGNGLDFMRARFYDSSLGRFTAVDPIGLDGGDTNFYRYVFNSPVNLIDPSGKIVPVAAGAAVAAGATAAVVAGAVVAVGALALAGYAVHKGYSVKMKIDKNGIDFKLIPPGGSTGDPHLKTLDGVKYDFQAAGEFSLVKSTTDDFEVQTRQEHWRGKTNVSVNTAIALKLGGQQIEFYLNAPDSVIINGNSTAITNNLSYVIGQNLIAHNGNKYTVISGNGDQINISFQSDYINVSVALADNRKGNVVGLLGNYNGNVNDEFALRDGTLIGGSISNQRLYTDYGKSWSVTQPESLFDYAPGQNTNISFSSNGLTFDTLDPQVRASAEQIVRNAGITDPDILENAIVDFVLTNGSPEFFQGYVNQQRELAPPGSSFTLVGDDANDILGGIGVDSLMGGKGNDTYFVDNAADTIIENTDEGTDRVFSIIDYTLTDNVEKLTLQGTTAIDGTGNELNNSITGNAADNVLTGDLGNDTLNGGAGADTMIGGLGNDSYNVDNAADTIIENLNEGTDRVSSTINYTLGDNLENLTLTGTTAIDGTGNELNNSITGNGAANVLTGGLGNDALNGGAGADTMIGGLGNDSYNVDNTADTITENLNEGTDSVFSTINYTLGDNLENLTLTGTTAINGTGNALNNSIIGNAAANVLTGGLGNDTLNGGAGADTMIGGLGTDRLYLGLNDNAVDNVNYVLGDATDTVYQFVRGVGGDQLNFSGIANFDVITSGTSTLVRVGDGIGGNAGFATGQLLVTLSGTSGFNSTNFGDNLFGGTFLFS
jgi:RHS repeat-associated protein